RKLQPMGEASAPSYSTIRILSRGNYGSRPRAAKTDLRPAGRQGRETDIKKTGLKHEQEGYRNELSMDNREPKEVGEINRESQLCQRERRFEGSVFAASPRL